MNKPQKTKRNAKPSTPVAAKRGLLFPGVVVLVVAALAVGGFWWRQRRAAPSAPEVVSASAVTATNPPVPSSTSNTKFEKLQGKWVRPDGGYILEIRSAAADGKLDAGYFNPRSINVAKAVALQDGQAVKVFIELRDVNYPGSTYTLVYDAGSDQLQGIYYQAAMQQQYDVYFERVK